ncbi:hypothetical protein Tco_0454041 [Tanacetum coccineum]
MEYCEDKDDSFTDLETEYPAIVFNDASDVAFSREPTVSPLDNNKIDFNISFDESDDEDYMAVFDKNSFSCKIIYVNNLKTDSENENDKVNMPSSPLPEPTIGYIDDLDFFKDFENEFPDIAYNDLKSKSYPLIDPSISSQHIDKFKISLFEYDEEEQNVLYLNNSFPLDVIFSNNPKTIKDNDDNIDITQLSGSKILNIDTKTSNELPSTNHDKTNKVFNEKIFIITLDADIVSWNCFNNWMPLNLIKNLYVPFGIQFDPKRYYKDGAHIRILRRPRPNHKFKAKTCDIALLKAVGQTDLHSEEEMVEAGFEAYWSGRERVITDKGDLRDYWIEISSDMEFLGLAPSYVHIRDHVRRLCHKMIACSISGREQGAEKVTRFDLFYLRTMDHGTANVPYLLAYYLFRHAEGRKSVARLSGGYFIGRLAAQFGLVSDEGLRDRQQAATADAPGAAKDAPAPEEGA